MEMKNVKKITLPNKVPVYDNDYKQLEYIHFNGAEYITASGNLFSKYLKLKVIFLQDLGNTTGACVLGKHDYANDRYMHISAYGTTSISKYIYARNSLASFDSAQIYVGSINSPVVFLADNTTGRYVASGYGSAQSTNYPIGNTNTSDGFTIGCALRKTSSTSYNEDYWKGNFYGMEYTLDTGDSSATGYFYPAQRKSDNVCGLYYFIPGTSTTNFFPMQGTTITGDAAGTTVSENMLIGYEDIDVKKIENSNGDIIWGSYDAFPYRRLEYIHFNGNDYIDSGFTPWNNFSYYLDIQWDQGAVGQYSGHGRVISNNRCYIGSETGGKVAFGTGAYSSTISSSNTFERHKYLVRTGPSSGTGVFDIDGVQKWYGASNFVESNRGTMFIGGVYRNTGEYSLCNAKIYNVRFTNNASTATTWTWNLIPVQRKSDGVIGFLKLKASGATPDFMTSVNGLLEAGPTVDEYWDMTNPF